MGNNSVRLNGWVIVSVFVLLLGTVATQAMMLSHKGAKLSRAEVTVAQLSSELGTVKDERKVLRVSLYQALGITRASLDASEQLLKTVVKYKNEVTALRWVVMHEQITDYITTVNRAAPAGEIATAILSSSSKYRLDPLLLLAQMEQESHFHACAVSSSGALGLMQLVRSTAKSLGVPRAKICDVGINVDAGSRYMARHLRTYKADYWKAWRRYIGPGDPLYEQRIERRHKRIVRAVVVAKTDVCKTVTVCRI